MKLIRELAATSFGHKEQDAGITHTGSVPQMMTNRKAVLGLGHE